MMIRPIQLDYLLTWFKAPDFNNPAGPNPQFHQEYPRYAARVGSILEARSGALSRRYSIDTLPFRVLSQRLFLRPAARAGRRLFFHRTEYPSRTDKTHAAPPNTGTLLGMYSCSNGAGCRWCTSLVLVSGIVCIWFVGAAQEPVTSPPAPGPPCRTA
jgi:hypothetical protein